MLVSAGIWSTGRSLKLAVACLIAGIFPFLDGFTPLLASAPFAILSAALTSFCIYKHFSAKKSLEWSLLTNEGLIKQNGLLAAMHSKLEAFQSLLAKVADARDSSQALIKPTTYTLLPAGLGHLKATRVGGGAI